MKPSRLLPRVLMLITVLIALLGGMGSGLARLGWQMDPISRDWLLVHGPLMIGGFLGTLLSLERAVALATRYPWAIAVPAVNAMGAIALFILQDAPLAKGLLTLGSAGLVLLFALMLRIHPSRDIIIMAIGAITWLVGNLLWLTGSAVFEVVHLWAAFLILTIVGERLELSRVRRLSPTSIVLLTSAVGVYTAGVGLTIVNLGFGIRILGAGAILMALWLLRYDIARTTILKTGLPRYIAACLLAGYVWLAFGGGIAIWKGAVYAGPDYAIILHAFLLGFVFSMIFGHMPIILPALTGLRMTFTPVFYVPLVLLHTSLILRMVGNLALSHGLRQWGGMINAITILLFFTITVAALVNTNRHRPAPRKRNPPQVIILD